MRRRGSTAPRRGGAEPPSPKSLAEAVGLQRGDNLATFLVDNYFGVQRGVDYIHQKKEQLDANIQTFLDNPGLTFNGQRLTADNIRVNSGEGNNAILFIQTDQASVVMELGSKRGTALEAIHRLGENPWIATSFGRTKFEGRSDFIDSSDHINKNLNPFDLEMGGYVSIVEMCPSSLMSRVRAIHDPVNTEIQNPISMTQFMGLQLSKALKSFSDKHIIWTDLKPENLLLREKDRLVISDVKAFRVVGQLILDEKKSGTYVLSEDTTAPYMSRDTLNKLTSPSTRLQAQGIWEKEYSYQVAIILYYTATNTPLNEIVSSKKENNDIQFDFNKPIFQDEQGQRLRTVIERLSAGRGEDRLHHTDAVKLLNTISNKEKFDTQIAEAVGPRKSSSQTPPKSNTTVIMSTLARDRPSTIAGLQEMKSEETQASKKSDPDIKFDETSMVKKPAVSKSIFEPPDSEEDSSEEVSKHIPNKRF